MMFLFLNIISINTGRVSTREHERPNNTLPQKKERTHDYSKMYSKEYETFPP